MNEFEKSENNEEMDGPFFVQDKSEIPDDFTEEELTFAAEIHTLFSPAEEDLPPYYVQTLLDADDQRFEPAARRFEQQTSARVFHNLKLKRSLFRTHFSPVRSLCMHLGDTSFRRPLLTIATTFLLLMLFTVAFTASSFASGVALLLRGSHENGAYPIKDYPPPGLIHDPHPNTSPDLQPAKSQIPLSLAQQQLTHPLYWSTYMLPGYTLHNINFYVGIHQHWIDGPIIEFEYNTESSIIGSGQIWIREFKPRMNVLELVKDGSSTLVGPDSNGDAMAIYINGQWRATTGGRVDWVFGGRSELLYQIHDTVFWIAGDQRNGVGEKELLQIAQGLLDSPRRSRMSMSGDNDPTLVHQLYQDNSSGPFSTDVILLPPRESAHENGPYYVSVTPSALPKNTY